MNTIIKDLREAYQTDLEPNRMNALEALHHIEQAEEKYFIKSMVKRIRREDRLKGLDKVKINVWQALSIR